MAEIAYNPLPSRAQILSSLDYDPETGFFRWKETSRNRKKGAVAGYTNHSYIRIKLDGVTYAAHRLAYVVVTGRSDLDGYDVDHKNGRKFDNRRENLRLVSRSLNVHNAPPPSCNKSGYRGVQWRPYNCKWIAKITVQGRIHHLGTFAKKEDAIAARLAAEKTFGVKRYVLSRTHG